MKQENLNKMNLQERYSLASGRIHEICSEGTVPAPFCDFFQKTARFLVQMEDLKNCLESGAAREYIAAVGTAEQCAVLRYFAGAVRHELRKSGLCG